MIFLIFCSSFVCLSIPKFLLTNPYIQITNKTINNTKEISNKNIIKFIFSSIKLNEEIKGFNKLSKMFTF